MILRPHNKILRSHQAFESTQLRVTRFFLSLLSRNFDDQFSCNFQRFVILCICWDTPSEKTGFWKLPIVSYVFKRHIGCWKGNKNMNLFLCLWLYSTHVWSLLLPCWRWVELCSSGKWRKRWVKLTIASISWYILLINKLIHFMCRFMHWSVGQNKKTPGDIRQFCCEVFNLM